MSGGGGARWSEAGGPAWPEAEAAEALRRRAGSENTGDWSDRLGRDEVGSRLHSANIS